jgi:hypothetical protein
MFNSGHNRRDFTGLLGCVLVGAFAFTLDLVKVSVFGRFKIT